MKPQQSERSRTKRPTSQNRPRRRPVPAGYAARDLAVDILEQMAGDQVPVDAVLESDAIAQRFSRLDVRDRAFVRTLVGCALRRRGEIQAVASKLLHKKLPRSAGRADTILRVGLAQLLYLDVAEHAAVHLSVDLAKAHPASGGFAGLVNGVLRRAGREREALLADIDGPVVNTPDWLFRRWACAYGRDTARAIAAAHMVEPALDVTVKSDPGSWAERLSGIVLPTGSVRTTAGGAIAERDGFTEGAWWVQDAAAALPARLMGDVAGKRVADLCAAPGGKTAQLAAAGGIVTAVDSSAGRLRRLTENLARLSLSAETVASDLRQWEPDGAFDAVLLDAPCTSTGTIRRQPDVALLKREKDIAALADLQSALLERAAAWVKPGGTLVYSTCSLEPEEGEKQIEAFLKAHPDFSTSAIRTDEVPGLSEAVTTEGWLRTLPSHWPHEDPRLAGLDGFFAARLVRAG
ncbi:RsmB/NOP family class I SAM-dependent RNA methyltransferase [Amorphus coralli]|uniref:RsmB/NOP family class I SAM-dependent RNA methyltransferase n=1 Tax=Amorphus coralli TaxID=340680 RepID=UPI00037D2001|nr:RsmB/NOP family class I SAM-dependent RNA methyltransferase [Amorphus coralli]